MTREEAIRILEYGSWQDYLNTEPMTDYEFNLLEAALDMAVSALREQEERRWISCKEKLPSKIQKVIFYCPSYDAVYAGRFNYVGKNGTVWFKTGRTSCSYGGTNWMPLPEPPEGAMKKDHNQGKEHDYGNQSE